VKFYAMPADVVTFARITRYRGVFRCHMFTGSFESLPRDQEEALGMQTSGEWPHAFARFNCSYDTFVNQFSSNHMHAAIGDYIGSLKAACEELDIEPIVLE
jgi:L-fucose isomerase